MTVVQPKELVRPQPVGLHREKRGSAVRALSRVEFVRLLQHPVVVVGTVLSVFVLEVLGGDQLPELGRYSAYNGTGLAPLAVAAVLASHLNTSRADRDAATGLLAPLSMSRTQRTVAHIAAATAPAAVALLLTGGYFIYLIARGASGSPDLAVASWGVLAVFVGAVVGTAAGVWVPGGGGGVVAAGLLLFAHVVFHDAAPGTLHWLALWRTVPEHVGSDLWVQPSLLHAAYLISLAGLFAAAAIRRSAARLGTGAALFAATGLVALGIPQLTPPSSTEVRNVLTAIVPPAGGDDCRMHGDVEYCVFPPYRRWVREWDPLADQVLEPVPAGARAGITVVQRRDRPLQLLDELDPESVRGARVLTKVEEVMAARTPGFTAAAPDPDPIYVTETWSHVRNSQAFAVAVAHRAVGLPTAMALLEPREPEGERMLPAGDETTRAAAYKVPDRIAVPCHAEGQARAVIALWLAAQGGGVNLPRSTHERDTVFRGAKQNGSYRYVQWAQFDPYDGSTFGSRSPVRWGQSDLHLAHELMQQPRDDVAAALTANWAQWTEPDASAQVLVEHFGLTPAPSVRDRLDALGVARSEQAKFVEAYPNEWHHPATDEGINHPVRPCR